MVYECETSKTFYQASGKHLVLLGFDFRSSANINLLFRYLCPAPLLRSVFVICDVGGTVLFSVASHTGRKDADGARRPLSVLHYQDATQRLAWTVPIAHSRYFMSTAGSPGKHPVLMLSLEMWHPASHDVSSFVRA